MNQKRSDNRGREIHRRESEDAASTSERSYAGHRGKGVHITATKVSYLVENRSGTIRRFPPKASGAEKRAAKRQRARATAEARRLEREQIRARRAERQLQRRRELQP